MATESVTLQDLHEELQFITGKISQIEESIEEIDYDFHKQIKPKYLEKLKKIKRGKTHRFQTKEEFLNFLDHEI